MLGTRQYAGQLPHVAEGWQELPRELRKWQLKRTRDCLVNTGCLPVQQHGKWESKCVVRMIQNQPAKLTLPNSLARNVGHQSVIRCTSSCLVSVYQDKAHRISPAYHKALMWAHNGTPEVGQPKW